MTTLTGRKARRAAFLSAFVCVAGAVPLAYAAQQTAPTSPAAPSPNTAVAETVQSMVGKPAPIFTLPDQNDKPKSLADNKGKWVVLAFYPADMTTGCTFQNKSYSDNNTKFAPLNAVVYTVSTQDTNSKKQFCSKEGLTHTLLSDVGGKVATQYGVLNGKYARRFTFYIAPDGTVAGVDTKIHTQQAAQDSLAMLAKLQAAPPAAAPTTAPQTEIIPSNGGRISVTGGQITVTNASSIRFVGPAGQKVAMGAALPDFGLPNAATGKQTAFSTLSAGKQATVLVWVSTQCPVSNAYNERMAALAATYAPKGVQFVGINSNVTEDAATVASHATQNNLTFPILKDADDKVANQFKAQVTPEVFVSNNKGVLVYHGPIDDSQNPSGVQKNFLAKALDATLAGKPVQEKSVRAFGCSIKRNN